MDNKIIIEFGIPIHGWLPVNFNLNEFHLNFEASDVLNNPIEELYNAITKLQDKESRQITWWLEPAAYIFEIEKKGKNLTFEITQTENLHKQSAPKKSLLKITAEEEQIIIPFRKALKLFCSQTYENNNWSYIMDKNKVEAL